MCKSVINNEYRQLLSYTLMYLVPTRSEKKFSKLKFILNT